MPEKLKFAFIGCGRIAKRHAQILSVMDDVKLVAVCDIINDRARSFSTEYDVPCYTDYHKMLKDEDIDVVSVLTPSGSHAEIGIDVAKTGRHVIVEKPMALRLEDADALTAACSVNKVELFVVKQNRYNLPVIKLREAIDGGRFGKLVLGTVRVRWCRRQDYYDQDAWRGTWAMDGGVFTNQASHHIDLLQWMMGPVESVMAKTGTMLTNIETEDTGVAILKFQNGALGVIEATTCTRPKDLEGSISVLGEKGSVEIAGFAVNKMKIWNFEEPLDGDEEVIEKYAQNPPDVYGFGHNEFLRNVVDCIKDGRHSIIDGLEGRKSLELINAIYESVETGREVFLRFKPKRCRLGMRDRG
ncbi:MAG: Gfo/Idh/MocA family oxidoreductase [Deltaproteobacteria bacterium]|nr:Gfo/Idh/MocA family oxidoreductase [Deltaproteobacteria bacterium]